MPRKRTGLLQERIPPHLRAYRAFLPSKIRFLSSTRFQITCVIATAVLVLLLLRPILTRFNSADPWPELIPISPKKQALVVGATAEVSVGLFIREFPEFNILHNKFIFDGIVWFEFDPAILSLTTVEKFSFEKGTILKKSPPDTKLIKGRLFARYDIRVQFSTNLNHRFFPLNDHRIFIVLTNEFVSPDELIFRVSEAGFAVSEGVMPQGWNPIRNIIRSGFSRSQLDRHDPAKTVAYPRVVFAIDFAKPGIRKIMIIMMPIFVVFLLGLFSLVLDPLTQARAMLSLSVGSLSGLLAYRFVIERLSPEVGYFTLTDHMYTLFLMGTFGVFLLNIYSIVRATRSHYVRLTKDVLFVVFQIIIITIWYYLLYHWGRQ